MLRVLFLLALCFLSDALQVNVSSSGLIVTHLQPAMYEGISFMRRAKNVTEFVNVSYKVLEVSDASVLKFSWLLDGKIFTVVRTTGKDTPPQRNAPYTSETFDKSTQTLALTLHLKDTYRIPGVYHLTVTENDFSVSTEGFVYSAPILPLFTKPKRVLQGDPIRISCQVIAYPAPLKVRWSFGSVDVSKSDDEDALRTAFEGRSPLTNFSSNMYLSNKTGVTDDTLHFNELQDIDNGVYVCNASNEYGWDTTLLLVNVKNRWAALWPFIGIVVEVTIMVTAILLCERHQLRCKPAAIGVAAEATEGNGNAIDVNATKGVQDTKDAKTEDVRLRNTTRN